MTGDALWKLAEQLAERHHRPCQWEIRTRTKAALVLIGQEPMFRRSVLNEENLDYIVGGMHMEQLDESLRLAAEELLKSKAELQTLVNEMGKLKTHVLALLADQIKEVRESRMALTGEMGQMLVSLREVRKFFLEDPHEAEATRLTHFVQTCRELRQLVDDGTLEALSDAILKMSVKP